ncbi:MAG TPA: hypothetical protein VLX56_06390 [Nitrososphaerales archaeon]|nr:hypothetical protein [Nitrososphaerales archaeon]
MALPPGIETTGYPPQAVRYLAWDDLYSDLYIGAIGLLAIAIGLKAFRRAEKWAWYSVLAFALAGFLTGLLDYLSWGGWYTSLFFGLPPLVGLLLSAKSFFQRKPRQKEASKKMSAPVGLGHSGTDESKVETAASKRGFLTSLKTRKEE